jgi:hypothetical protein
MDTAQQRATQHNTASRLLYNRKEAAHQLSISVRAVDYLIEFSRISVRRIGTRVLIPHSELVRVAAEGVEGSVIEEAAA